MRASQETLGEGICLILNADIYQKAPQNFYPIFRVDGRDYKGMYTGVVTCEYIRAFRKERFLNVYHSFLTK